MYWLEPGALTHTLGRGPSERGGIGAGALPRPRCVWCGIWEGLGAWGLGPPVPLDLV